MLGTAKHFSHVNPVGLEGWGLRGAQAKKRLEPFHNPNFSHQAHRAAGPRDPASSCSRIYNFGIWIYQSLQLPPCPAIWGDLQRQAASSSWGAEGTATARGHWLVCYLEEAYALEMVRVGVQ
jgi:hypothetical protein